MKRPSGLMAPAIVPAARFVSARSRPDRTSHAWSWKVPDTLLATRPRVGAFAATSTPRISGTRKRSVQGAERFATATSGTRIVSAEESAPAPAHIAGGWSGLESGEHRGPDRTRRPLHL